MYRFLTIVFAVVVAFTSCNTTKNVVYFQDLTSSESEKTQGATPIRFVNGDKITIVVTSAKTPGVTAQYNLPAVQVQTGAVTNSTNGQQQSVYTIDEKGQIEMPWIGKVDAAGRTRTELTDHIQEKLRKGHVSDAIVTVNAYDRFVTVLGEVKSPGKVTFNKDYITILEALGSAGDLTIQARRDRILVVRETNGDRQNYYIDLRSKDAFNSPVYYLQQNDVIYVEPNKIRAGQSTVNDNSLRSITTWMSIFSFLTSMAILIFR